MKYPSGNTVNIADVVLFYFLATSWISINTTLNVTESSLQKFLGLQSELEIFARNEA